MNRTLPENVWKRLLRITLMLLTVIPQSALAQKLNTQKEALQIIGDFADRLCLKIPLEGSGSNLELSGAAKAELESLLKKIASLGIQGSAKYQQSQFQGLLQKDLVTALKNSTDCKLRVLDALKDKLLSAATEPKAPTAEDVAEAVVKRLPKQQLAFTFTESPLFTRARKQQITQEWTAFYHYLEGVGFDLPKDVPPVRISHGNAMSMSWQKPSISESGGHIGIPEQWLADPELIRSVYAVWLFRKLFGIVDNPPWSESQSQLIAEDAVSLFACYYGSSFSNRNVCDHDWTGRGWNNGLWRIRVNKGQEFTDRLMFATYKTWGWMRPGKIETSFDEFFGLRLRYGISLIDPSGHEIPALQQILQGSE